MKEDYLWDKTGSDPAIEKLESALRVFSAAEAPRPVFPVETAPVNKGFFSRFAPFALAAAGFVAVVAIAFVVSIQLLKAPVQDSRASISGTADVSPASRVPKPDPPYIKDKILTAEKPGSKQFVKVASEQKPLRKTRTVLRTIPAEVKKPKFTAEEIYAYNQLMLALTITSDKLGQVRDKAIGED